MEKIYNFILNLLNKLGINTKGKLKVVYALPIHPVKGEKKVEKFYVLEIS